MKKRLAIASLAIISAACANAVVIYDTITPTTGPTFSTSVPHNHMGDGFSTLAPGANQTWKVNRVRFGLVIVTARAYTNVVTNVKFWGKWDSTNTTNVFSNQLSNVNVNIGSFNGTASTYFDLDLDYLGNGLAFNIGNGQNVGIDVTATENGQATNDLTILLTRVAPSVGTSTNGYYRDANGDGIFQNTDLRSFGGPNDNQWLKLDAEAVPEPATMAVLGLGLAAIARKRVKKA